MAAPTAAASGVVHKTERAERIWKIRRLINEQLASAESPEEAEELREMLRGLDRGRRRLEALTSLPLLWS